jgi:hypothetical protein
MAFFVSTPFKESGPVWKTIDGWSCASWTSGEPKRGETRVETQRKVVVFAILSFHILPLNVFAGPYRSR